jgi:hypothetical protein
MLTIIVASVVALGLACVVLIKSRVTDSAQLNQSRPSLLTIGVQIICGDCSGEGDQPVKTYLNEYGGCSHCQQLFARVGRRDEYLTRQGDAGKRFTDRFQ